MALPWSREEVTSFSSFQNVFYQFRFQVKDVPEETLTAGDAALQSSLVERGRVTVTGLGTGARMTDIGAVGEI